MKSRASRYFGKEQNTAPGIVPDYGAIFMSNADTKKECFRRKLLGLPSVQAPFVKHVKAGMILFLFEHESRELHGVFQACSDGAMNIVPHAYRSSGRQFPAQVKFIPMWHCSPLSEKEFRGAIRENYYSAYKFNFGLSERQVRRLLLLFSSRKIKDKPTLRKVPRPIGCSRSEADEGSFPMVDDRDNLNADGRYGSVISTRYSEGSICSGERVIDEDCFASAAVGNTHKVDIEREQFGDLLGKVGRLVDDGRTITNDPVAHECGMDIHPRLVALHDDAGQSFVRNSGVSDDVSYATSEQFGDLLGKVGRLVDDGRTITNDPVGNEHVDIHPRLVALPNYSGQSFVMNRGVSNDVRFATDYEIRNEPDDGNDFGPPKLTKYHDFVQSNTAFYSNKPSLEANSLISEQLQPVGCVVGLDNSNVIYSSSYGDGMAISNVPYPTSYGDAIIRNALPYVQDISSLTRYNPDVPSLNHGSPSSLRRSNPLPECSHRSIFPCIEDQSCPSPVEPNSASRYPNTTCLSDVPVNSGIDLKSEIMYSDRQKDRMSVFDRIVLPPKRSDSGAVFHGENDQCDMDSSVDEIMAVLHQSHFQWSNAKSFKPVVKKIAYVENCGSRRDVTSKSMFLEDCQAMTSKGIITNDIPSDNENGVQVDGVMPFVDFKRRCKARKTQDDKYPLDHTENLERGDSSGGQLKRRKLVRPKFSKNISSGDTVGGNLDNEKKTSQNFGSPHEILQTDSRVNLDAERGPNCDDDKKEKSFDTKEVVESFMESLRNIDEDKQQESPEVKKEASLENDSIPDEDKKEASQNVGIPNLPLSISCKDESHNAEEVFGKFRG